MDNTTEYLGDARLRNDSGLLNADETAAYTRLSVSSIRKLTARNRIPHIRIGRRVLYRRAELDEWLDAKRTADAA
jgi:excisionase family DNA binding protein